MLLSFIYQDSVPGRRVVSSTTVGGLMIVLGIALLIAGLLLKISILYTIGVILLVVGLVLVLMSTLGHAVGGRRHYY